MARRTASRARRTLISISRLTTPGPPSRPLGLGENGRYTTALTFGNVHGAYKPGHVKLRPELLGEIQADVAKRLGDRLATKVGDKKTPFDLVMHGGSGSTAEEIATAVRNGVIKMNVDTDTQYAFTRPVADHMFKNYDGVLKIDGEVGSKKAYDPRAWGKAAEKGMAARVVETCERLGSVGSAKRRARPNAESDRGGALPVPRGAASPPDDAPGPGARPCGGRRDRALRGQLRCAVPYVRDEADVSLS